MQNLNEFTQNTPDSLIYDAGVPVQFDTAPVTITPGSAGTIKKGQVIDRVETETTIPAVEAKKATVTVRFSLAEAAAEAVTINANTQVKAADSEIKFKTKASATIGVGETSVDVECECTTAGTSGNGFEIGSIDTLVVENPSIDAVSNTTVSEGGVDAKEAETTVTISYAKHAASGKVYAIVADDEEYDAAASSVPVAVITSGNVKTNKIVTDVDLVDGDFVEFRKLGINLK